MRDMSSSFYCSRSEARRSEARRSEARRSEARRCRPYVLALVLVAFALAIVSSAAPAIAQEPPPSTTRARVDELKHRGNQAMLDLNYGEALDAYTAAIAIAPEEPTLYYNLGRAHQAREDYPAALDALEQFARRAAPEIKARVPTLDALINDVRSRVGTVSVTCTTDLPAATIKAGDRTTAKGCTSRPTLLRVSVPTRRSAIDVRLTADGYQGQTARVTVDGGAAPVQVALTVLPTSTSGMLVARATPVHARISVDGVERGNPPLDLPIPAGSHVLDLRADGHDSAHLEVVVEAGKRRELSIDLQRTAPITSKWWFWTAAGVVAAGIGVAVWYLVVQPEEDPSRGTIEPGRVSAPLLRF